MENENELLTPTQAAQLLGISAHQLKRWRQEQPNRLPHLRYNSKVVKYRRSDINAFLKRALSGGSSGSS